LLRVLVDWQNHCDVKSKESEQDVRATFMRGMRILTRLCAVIAVLLGVLLALASCVMPAQEPLRTQPAFQPGSSAAQPQPTEAMFLPFIRRVDDPTIMTPTPDAVRELPGLRTEEDYYVVQVGDTLGNVARRYGVSLSALIERNELTNPDLLSVGQELVIPVPEPGGRGPGFKVIPDSELVYGPNSADFDIEGFVEAQDGYLARYHDDVEGQTLSGAEVVERVANEFSVNPRLLLAVLEYQSGWLRQSNPDKDTLDQPLGNRDYWRKGLYLQLAWAANNLNRGFYQWRVNAVGSWVLTDGMTVPIDPTINAGTAGVQSYYALLYDRPGWEQAVTQNGLFAVYASLFGYPFDYTVEPLMPEAFTQPPMQLPFEDETEWSFTGGPHGGWGDGSAWAGLDFAPPGEPMGCVVSEAWVAAVADGLVVRSENGSVVQDLDGDGIEQTGWTVLYLHIDQYQRVQEGTYLRAGERLGHPSCEGGYSTGTHLHLARRYNGEWIPADQAAWSFVLDGWSSTGTGVEYDGFLTRDDGQSIEAWNGRFDVNQISRP